MKDTMSNLEPIVQKTNTNTYDMSRMIENEVVSKGEQILSIQEHTIDGMVI